MNSIHLKIPNGITNSWRLFLLAWTGKLLPKALKRKLPPF